MLDYNIKVRRGTLHCLIFRLISLKQLTREKLKRAHFLEQHLVDHKYNSFHVRFSWRQHLIWSVE